jgi:Flp pilus assembly protein TadD
MNKPPHTRRGPRPAKPAARPGRAPAGREIRLPIYLSRIILALAGFVLFLPLVVSYDFYEPFVFVKSILFRVVVGAMLLLYVVLAALFPPYRPRFHRITYAALAYFSVMILCSLPGVSINAWASWWGSFARMDGMFTQLHILAYFFVLTQTLKTEREWLILFTASLFSGVLLGLSGLLQYLELPYIYRQILEPRIMGATGNANNFALLMVLDAFVVLWFLGRRDRHQIYPFLAKIWMMLLVLLDLFLVVWEFLTLGRGDGVLSVGLALPPLAAFALLLHALSLLWFFKRESMRLGSAFLAILGLYFLFWAYQSQTRFAVIGFAGSLVILCFLYILAGGSRKAKWLAAASIALALMVPSAFYLGRNSSWIRGRPALARLTSVSFATAAPRLMAWKAGVLGMLDRPVLGWGLENYKNAFDLHFPPELFTSLGSEGWYDRAHNVVIDLGVTTGALGLAAFSALYGLAMAALIRTWLRTKDPTDSILVAALLLAYLIQNLFSFDTVNTNGVVFLLLAYVTWLCAPDRLPGGPANHPHSERARVPWQGWLAIGLSGLMITGSYWYLVKRPWDSNRLLARAIASSRTRSPSGSPRYVLREDIADMYRQAGALETTGRNEVRERFASYASGLAQDPGIPLRERARMVRKAVDLLEESIREEPADARHKMYAVSLINRSLGVLAESEPALARKMADKALVLSQQAEELSPTRPQVYIERAKTLVWAGRTAEAIAALERVVGLSPWVKEPHIDLVTLCISSGRYDEAAREWSNARRLSGLMARADYDRVIRSYTSKKRLGSIASLYLEQIEKTPDDPDLLMRLAATYRDMGETESARQTAMKAASLSPNVAATLRTFMQSLEGSR